VWVFEEVRRQELSGVTVDEDVVDTARGPLEIAAAYKSMYAYRNHFRVISSERSMQTSDSGVAATFTQVCRNGIRDVRQVQSDVEYVGHIEEILELNYRQHCIVVLVCDFVKANYMGDNATIVKDKWGFTLANYERRPGIICRDSFAFPKHCQQVFYSNAREAPGWKVVLRKEVRAKRILPHEEEEREAEMFHMGHDDDFDGLRPEINVGEGPAQAVATGHNVFLREDVPPGRQSRGRSTGRRSNARSGRMQEGARGEPSGLCAGRVPRQGQHASCNTDQEENVGHDGMEHVDEEDYGDAEILFTSNLEAGILSQKSTHEDEAREDRRTRRHGIQRTKQSSSEEETEQSDAISVTSSSSDSSSSNSVLYRNE